MLSKELLSEVLKTNVKKVVTNIILIHHTIDGLAKKGDIAVLRENGYKTINQHELSYLCKKWLLKKGYNIQIIYNHKVVCITAKGKKQIAREEDEATAVFNFCQDVLEGQK